MIVKLSGKLDYVGEDCVHVSMNAGDITHELMIPAADVPLLQTKVGQNVSFFTVNSIPVSGWHCYAGRLSARNFTGMPGGPICMRSPVA